MGTLLLCEPAEVVFHGVRFHQAHSQTVRITNTTKASVEGDVKASSSDRYTITPSSFRLKPGEAAELSISLRLEPKFAQRRKAIDSGQRDAIFIKTVHFDQRLSCTFFLHPDEEFKGTANSAQLQSVSPQRLRPGELSSPRRAASSPLRSTHKPAASISRAQSSPLRGSSSSSGGGGGGSEGVPPSPRAGDGSRTATAAAPLSPRQLGAGSNSSNSSLGGSSRLLRWTAGPEAADQLLLHPEPRAAVVPRPQAASVPALKRPSTTAATAAAAAATGTLSGGPDQQVPVGARRVRKSVSFAGLPPPGAEEGSLAETAKTAAVLRRSVSQSSAVELGQGSGLFDEPRATAGLRGSAGAGSFDAVLPQWRRPAGSSDAAALTAASANEAGASNAAAVAGFAPTKELGLGQASSAAAAAGSGRLSQQLLSWVPRLPAVTEELSQELSSSSSSRHHSSSAGSASDHGLHSSGSSSQRLSAGAAGLHSVTDASRLGRTAPKPHAPVGAVTTAAATRAATSSQLQQQQEPESTEVVQLRAALKDAQRQLQDSQALVAQLQQASPEAAALVETGRKQEQALQEERNRRALELLLQKDQAIAALQEQLAAAGAAQDRAEASAAAANARAEALQVALQEAGNAAAAELAVVQQAHAAVMAALEEKLCAQEKHLSAASQQVLELSAQLAVLQGQPRSSRQPPAAPALGADEGSVSLDAGVAPTAHTPSADGGAGVEPANAAASISVSNGGSCGNRQHAELLELLAERDGAVARLESQLAVARAAVDGQADVPGESGADAQVLLLQRQLGEALAELQISRERLAEAQAVQALTEAAAEEGGLLAAQQQDSAGAALREAARSATEAQVARLTAARLNARVTALEGELAEVTAAKEGLEDKLDRQQELALREATLLRHKLTALLAAGGPSLAELDRELDEVLADADSAHADETQRVLLQKLQALQQHQQKGLAASRPGQQAELLSSQGLLASALEDAESTIALLQSKLVGTSAAASAAEARVADLQQRLTAAAVRRTREVASARAAGEVQLATLQDAVVRLGSRDDMAGQVAALSLELSNMRRLEVQLKGELGLAQQQLADAQQQLAGARQQVADEKQQAEAAAISATYPLARAARLLENWTQIAEQQLGAAPGSKSPRNGSSRPWPCFDASKPRQQQQQQQQQQRGTGHALPKPIAEWSPEQCAAAASAAASWVGELARGQQLLAAALQRAEQAEMELAALKLDGAAGSNILCLADTPAATATVLAAGVRALPGGSGSPRQQQGWQPGSVVAAGIAAASDQELRAQLSAAQQELAAARAELRAARQQRELADVELSRLSAEVQAAAAAAADAQGLLAAAEATARKEVESARHALLKAEQQADEEVGVAQLRIAEAEAAAAAAASGRNAAEATAAAAQQQAEAARAEASRLVGEVASVRQAAEAQSLDARQLLAAKDRELSRLSSELDSQQTRACVLLETLETLQAGNWDSEGQQRLVSLTAQVTAQAAQLAAAEERCNEALADAGRRAGTITRLRQQLDAAQQEAAGRAAAAAAAEGANAGLTRQLGELREQLKAATQQGARPARELSALQQRLSGAEAEAAGLRAALDAAQQRHSQQLAKLREEAAAAGQDALTQALRHDPPHAYIAHVAHMTAALDSLVAAVQGAHSSSKQLGPPGTAAAVLQGGSRGAIRSGGSRPNSRGGLLGGAQGSSMLALCEGFGDASLPWGGVCGDLSWSKGVVLRLKEMLLESDRMYMSARLEADVVSNQAASLSAQLAACQASEDRATALWQAAERAKQAVLRGVEQRDAAAAAFALERMQAQERHIGMLFSQAQQLGQQLVAAQAGASTAQAAAAAARQQAATLSLQLEAALSEVDALRRAAAAATQEAAGMAHWCLHRPPGSSSLQGGGSDAGGGSGTGGAGGEASVGEALRRRDEGLMKWFEARVVGLVKQQQGQTGAQGQQQQGEEAARLIALVREVCGLKLVESQLLASLAAANARSDASALRAQRLSAALETATTKLSATATAYAGGGSSAGGGGAGVVDAASLASEVAQLQAQLLARSQEAFELQDQLMQAKQLASARELESTTLQAQLSEHSQASTAQQASDAAALAAQRAALTAAAAAEEARLLREIQELRQLLQQQSSASSAALDAQREAAAQQADQSAAAAAESAQAAAAAALHAAEVRAALLEGQVEVAEQERDALLKQVTALQARADELQTSGDVSAATVQSLEATLAAIERAETRRAAQAGSTAGARRSGASSAAGSAAGSRQASRAGSASGSRQLSPQEGPGGSSTAEPTAVASTAGADGSAAEQAAGVLSGSGSAAALSKELVKAHTAAADAQRKLRVSARAEVELRQRLAERDGRIHTLKQELADNRRQADALQRRVNELLSGSSTTNGGGSNGSSRGGSGPGAHTPSRSPQQSPRGTTAAGSQAGVARLALPLEWVSDPNRQQPQEAAAAEAVGALPSAQQVFNRIGSGSSGRLEAASQQGLPSSHAGGAGLAAAEKEYLAHQIAALRISLAKRDADVARLEGALAEAVAQQQQQEEAAGRGSSNLPTPRPTPTAPAPASNRLSSAGNLSALAAGSTPGDAPADGAAANLLHCLQQQHQEQQQGGAGPGLGSRTASNGGGGVSGSGSGRLGLHSHSATAAARMAREASMKAAQHAADTAVLSRSSSSHGVQEAASGAATAAALEQQQQQQQWDEEHHLLAVQFAAASAQLASGLATARRVLADLVLGQAPSPQAQAELEAELGMLNLEEALTEVVYQVQEKLVAAAGVAEAATAEAAAALAQARVAGAAAQEADGHLQQLAAELIEARQVALSAAPAAVSTAAMNHHDAQLVAQLQAQLQAAAADRAGLAAQAEAVAAAHADQAQQLATLTAERESLAQQNAALAGVLGDRLASTAEAAPGVRPQATEQQVSRGQLRELGALLARLTKENAALMKARDAALQQQSALVATLAEQRGAAAELQAQLQSTAQQASQLDQLREQLQHELAAARQQLLELGAAQDVLRAQVAGARAERDTMADQAAALARTTHQLMAGGGTAAGAQDGSMSPGGVGSLGGGPVSTPLSAPVSLEKGGSGVASLQLRQRAASEPQASAADAAGATAAAQRITSGQLRDIGAMLARLTRENAALIKQRDRLEAAAAEAGTTAAAAEAAVAERQALLLERAAARAELDAARADHGKAAALVRQLTAERDRLMQQVDTLITERDSMASHNQALANTTSRLMAAGSTAGTPQEAWSAHGGGSSSGISGLLDSGFGAGGVGQRGASAPAGAALTALAAGDSTDPQQSGQAGLQHQHHQRAQSAGAVMSPSQAREIGGLLSRLTNENSQFLKARDAAVASRNEALNRAAALEAELELRQQEARSAVIELQRLKSSAGQQQQQQQQPHVQSADSAPRQQQHEAQSMSPQHSSASVGPRPQHPESAGGSRCAAACSEADAGRLLNLCCSLQRSVSCAESVQAALVEAISSSAATSPTGTAPQHLGQKGPASTGGGQQQQQQALPLPVQPGTLAQVLGAELSVLKDTAMALSEQLQRFGSAADQLRASSQQQPQQQQQPTSEFSFRSLQVVASQASISLDGADTPAEGQRPQQQLPLSGDSAGGAAAARSTAATPEGAVSVSPAVVQQLQATAQQQQRRCAKWKSRCKQLAQQLTLLTAQWVAGQAQAAATAAGTTDGTPAQQEQQQAAAAAAADTGEGGAGEAPSAQEVAAAVAAAAGMAALLSRLEEFEAQLDSRLQQSLGAAGALLTRGEGLAHGASASANALEVRVQPLLGCAAGLEAQVAVLEQRLADAQQRHEAAIAEQAGALEGAAELQAQLDELQSQLRDTSAAFAAEHGSLSEALAAAQAARDEAVAAAASAASELEGCKARLAEAEAAQARSMAELQTRHMSVTTELRRQLQEGASTPATLSAALRESEDARRASDAALCQLADDMRSYQAAKQAEVSRLEQQLEALLAAAPASLAAQFLAATAAAAAAGQAAQGGLNRSRDQAAAAATGRSSQQAAGAVRRPALFTAGLCCSRRRGAGSLGSRRALSGGSSRVNVARFAGSTARHSGLHHAAGGAQQHHGVGGCFTAARAMAGRGAHHLQQHQQRRMPVSAEPSSSSTAADADSTVSWAGSESEDQQQQRQQLQADLSQDLAQLAAAVSSSLQAEDALGAALREARWQQLGRVKAENAAEALRASCARLKARLRAARSEADSSSAAAQQGAAAAAELPKLQSELTAARESLKTLRAQQERQAQQQRSALSALAAAAGGAGEGGAALAAAAAAAAAASISARGTTAAGGAADVGQVLVLAHQQLCEAAVGREGLQAKLAEAKAAIERKNVLIRDLKARAESLGAQLSATASAAALEERALAAEGRAKALAASLGRKDAALREAQAAAAGLKAQLAEAQAAAAGGGPEVQASLARLRAELGRKEASVQAVSSNLEQIKQQLTAAHEASTKQQATAESSLKRQAARHQQQLTVVAHALLTACALLLSCMATMAASAGVLQHSMHSLKQQQHQQQPGKASSASLEAAAPADSSPESLTAAGVSVSVAAAAAAGLADMVALSGDELADLLGPEDDTCRMLLQQLQAQQDQEQQQLQELDAAADAGRELGMEGSAAERCLAQVRQGGSQALAEIEAEEAVAQRRAGLLQQLEDVVGQICSSSSSTHSGGSDGCTAASDRSGSVRGPYRPVSASSGAGKGGGCVEQGLQSVLQLLTQDVGAQQGSLRSAVCMTVTNCS